MKKYLIEKFGKADGDAFFSEICQRTEEILSKAENKSENQLKTMREKIVPRIAMYEVLQGKMSKEEAYEAVKDYMHNYVSAKSRKHFLRLEKIPFFPSLFQTEFVALMKKSDNWISECVRDDKTGCQVNIKKCLWFDTCKENGCGELAEIFCGNDDVTYGDLKKIKFSRSGTLAMGNEMCDFHYDR